MTRRRVVTSRLQRVMLSQGVTITICLCAMMSMVGSGVGWTSTAVLSLLIAVGMWALNKMFYFTHNASIAFAGIFMLLQCAMPAGVSISALIFAFAILTCTAILFSVFNNREYTRSMYLIFLILGTGAIFYRCYLWAVPLFLIGIVMMRAFSLRGLVASLLGLLTVPLLVLGFDLIPLEQLREPYTFISVDEMLDAFRHIGGMEMVASLTFATALCMLLGGVAFLTAYGYPARTRSYCMFFYLMAAASLLMAVVDFSDSAVPGTVLLNVCAAYHTSHFATSRALTGWVIPLVIFFSLTLNIF